MRRFYSVSIVLILPAFLLLSKPAGADNVFNLLYLKKMELEQKYGITNLECFPFLISIGSNADEAERVRQCLEGVTTLTAALQEAPGVRVVVTIAEVVQPGLGVIPTALKKVWILDGAIHGRFPEGVVANPLDCAAAVVGERHHGAIAEGFSSGEANKRY